MSSNLFYLHLIFLAYKNFCLKKAFTFTRIVQSHSAIRVNRIIKVYTTYDLLRGVYNLFCATHGFFCGIYGVVRGVFRTMHGVFGIFFLIPKKSKKTNATPHFDLQVKEKNENLCVLFGIRIFYCFRMLSGSKKIAVFQNPPE